MARLSTFFVEAANGGATASVNEISKFADFLQFAEDPLAAIQHLISEAEAHGFEISPRPASVGPDEPLVFRRLDTRSLEAVGAQTKALFESGELPQIELKSTLWLDTNRQKNDPGATAAQLKNPKVCHSAMKSICGFLNEDGGRLILGVADNRTVYGIENEFVIAAPSDPSSDGWLKALRSAVTQFFYEPDQILHQLKISLGAADGAIIALVEVVPRRKLSLCKCAELKQFQVYTRRGSSTEIVDMCAMEQYIASRLQRIAASKF